MAGVLKMEELSHTHRVASADNLAGEGTVTLYASWSLNKTFTYSHPYSYRVTDNSKEEPVKLHFFIDGASGTSTSGYTRTNSIYHGWYIFE